MEREQPVIFSNPNNLARADHTEAPGKGRDRVNLTIRYGTGYNFYRNRVLEPGFSGYSDLAASADRTVFCFYERGSTDGTSFHKPEQLTVARFNTAWIGTQWDSVIDTAHSVETVVNEFARAFSPSWDSGGSLYFSDPKQEKLLQYTNGQVAAVPGIDMQLAATCFRGNKLYLSDPKNSRILVLENGELRTRHQFATDERPGDLAVDSRGGVFAALPEQNRVEFLAPFDATCHRTIEVPSPTGLALCPGDSYLYISSLKERQIWRCSPHHAGYPAPQPYFPYRRLAEGMEGGPGGMTVDLDGNLYVVGSKEIWIWNERGQFVEKISCPNQPTACTFGDHDLKSLYITGFGGVYKQRMLVPGLAR
ncbi:MAG: SMP-30/gluconolactonase/LRE family protein [Planctomycetaceae bacterium]|nr:SMP-30/gluconolactonase/LRE family protein [Planctomycetaceae bacterium]